MGAMTEHAMDDATPRPPRRKRYRGKNPRNFDEKYKERDPARYAETVAKVIASGKTPAGSHIPIMMDECLEALALAPGMIGVDATLGYGGHAARILERISPGGMLIGADQDPIELPKTERRLRDRGFGPECFVAVRSNYAGIAKLLAERDMRADFVFADLGCSSMQFDDPSRGFSFKHDGPLDMRMNPTRGLSASDWLARTDAAKFERVLRENADEPNAELIAMELAGRNFLSTAQLAIAIQSITGIRDDEKDLTMRRVFQAIRIAVNEEFTALDAFLRSLPDCLKPGGRVAILTFHSGEDRRVKKCFQAGLRDGVFADISNGVITASTEERHENPRSSSAKLRWAVKVRE